MSAERRNCYQPETRGRDERRPVAATTGTGDDDFERLADPTGVSPYARGMRTSDRRLSASVVVAALLGLSTLTACGGASGNDGQDVSWRDAADHAGDTVTVCGPLKSTGSDGDDRFLNLGAPYPQEPRFTIVVWDNPGSVEDVDASSGSYRACATGEVSMYQGVPQIELDDGSDISVTER